MKIRITDNTIRIRLPASDVSALANRNSLQVGLAFPDGSRQHWSLVPDASVSGIEIRSNGPDVELLLPASWMTAWPEEERVGFERRIATAAGELTILVEKDLPCEH